MKNYFVIFLFVICGCATLKSKKDINVSDINATNSVEYNLNYTDGTKSKLLGNKNQAILAFIRCIEINPKSSGAYYQLAEIFSSNGETKKAIMFAKKAYELNSKNQWYILQLARLYQNSNVIDSTIILYNKLIQIAPVKEEYYLNLSFLYFKNNQPKKALKILNGFKSSFGLSEDVALTLYQIYKYENDSSNSVKILQQAITKFPEETRFYGLLAEQFMTSHQLDSALFYYKRLLAVDPQNDKGILSFIEYKKATFDTVGVSKYFSLFVENPDNELNDKIELISSFINDNRYCKKFSSSIVFYLDSLITVEPKVERLYLLKADFHLRNNDQKSAKSALVFVVTHYKANYVIWEQLLFTLNSLSQYNDLMVYAPQAISLFSDKPLPYLFEGMAYFYLKNYNQGIVSLNKGLQFVKDSKDFLVQFHTFLGECYHGVGDFEKSDYHFECVLKSDPQNVMVLNNYSYYLAVRNIELDKALNYIQVCINKFPHSATYLDTYSWILFKKGNFKEAKNAIEKALQYGGNGNMDIIEHYSEILYYNGDKTSAIKFYKILEENGKANQFLKKLFNLE